MSNSKFNKIADIIAERIESGDYQLNSKLPTHRLLADELATTPATVAKAYKLLTEKGQIESFIGRGTYVSPRSDLDQAIQAPEDEANFNFSLLQPCLYKNVSALQLAYRQAAEQFSTSLIGYTEHSGHIAHRQAGVDWAKQYGLEGGKCENTLLTSGAQHALSLLVETLTKPGDTVLVEALTYPGILAIASLSNRHIIGVDMDEDGLCPVALESAITAHKPALVIVIPSHQNPTGITMSEGRRKAIAAVINRHKIWLAEDDIYCFLDETPVPAITNFAPDYCFHISALSKALSPAMRCGFIKAPESKVALLNAHIRANVWLSSPINFIAATLLIESGEAFRIAELQRNIALERQMLARKILTEFDDPASGFHIWLPLPDHWQPERFTMEAKNRGLIVTSGSYFSANSENTAHVRLSLMSISRASRLEEGLKMLKTLLQSDANTLFPF